MWARDWLSAPIEGPAVGVHPVAVAAGAADGHQSIEAHLILQIDAGLGLTDHLLSW